MITEISNPHINVRKEVMNSDGEWVKEKINRVEQHSVSYGNRDLSNGRELILINNTWGKEVVIHALEIGVTGNNSMIAPSLIISNVTTGNETTEIFRGMSGAGYYDLTHRYVNLHGNPFFESTQNDSSSSRYKYSNKREIICPQGCKLKIYPLSNYDNNIVSFRVNLYYTVKEVE